MTKKRIATLLLALALMLSLAPTALAAPAGIAKASTQGVEVDGKKIEFQMYALEDANGGLTNYVKLRDVAHVLNSTPAKFSVGYDGTISITTGQSYTPNGSEMSTPYSGDRAYQPGPGSVKVNGADVKLDAILLTDDAGGGYTYFKLRDLGSALGFKVDWTRERGVFIETGTETTDGQITLADLQGIWHMALTKTGNVPISNTDIVISGNQFSEYSLEGSSYILRNGTITGFTVETNENWKYSISWSGVYQSKSGNKPLYEQEKQENLIITEVNLAEGYFIDNFGLRYEKATSSAVQTKVTAAIEEAKEILSKYPCYADYPTVPDFGAIYGLDLYVSPLDWEKNPDYRSGYTTFDYGEKEGNAKGDELFPYTPGSGAGTNRLLTDYVRILKECGYEETRATSLGGSTVTVYRLGEYGVQLLTDKYFITSFTVCVYHP